jgi:hypothetical protein
MWCQTMYSWHVYYWHNDVIWSLLLWEIHVLLYCKKPLQNKKICTIFQLKHFFLIIYQGLSYTKGRINFSNLVIHSKKDIFAMLYY